MIRDGPQSPDRLLYVLVTDSLLQLNPDRVKEQLANIYEYDRKKVAKIVEKRNLTMPPHTPHLANPRTVPSEVIQRYTRVDSVNPAGLHLLSYMTPMACLVGAKQRYDV